jgi:hypothetical protein
VEPDASAGEGAVRISWSRIALEPSIEPLGWSQEAPLTYPGT